MIQPPFVMHHAIEMSPLTNDPSMMEGVDEIEQKKREHQNKKSELNALITW